MRNSDAFLNRTGKKINRKRTIVDECREHFDKNPTPWKLGNCYCFFYNDKGQPSIVIGPDWMFSIIEIAVVNVITGYFLSLSDNKQHYYLFVIGMLVLIG